jgi:hypothetical protein
MNMMVVQHMGNRQRAIIGDNLAKVKKKSPSEYNDRRDGEAQRTLLLL